MQLLAEVVHFLAVPLLQQLLLRFELVDLALKLLSDAVLLPQSTLVSLLFKFELLVLLDGELKGLPLLGEENEQLFELLARLGLVLDGQLHLLLHDVVPLLQLERYLGLLRALLLLCLQLLSQLLDQFPVLLFPLLEVCRDLGVLSLC